MESSQTLSFPPCPDWVDVVVSIIYFCFFLLPFAESEVPQRLKCLLCPGATAEILANITKYYCWNCTFSLNHITLVNLMTKSCDTLSHYNPYYIELVLLWTSLSRHSHFPVIVVNLVRGIRNIMSFCFCILFSQEAVVHVHVRYSVFL